MQKNFSEETRLEKILLGKKYKDNIKTKGYGMDSTGSIGTNDRLLEAQK
jgi:hypothetical protein